MTSGEMLGSLFNQNGYSTARMRQIWSDENRVKVICQAEVAVAYAMAKNGRIPKKAYDEISAKLVFDNIDLRQLKIESARAGHFLAGFVKVVQPLFDDESGQYVHFGAASEDIEDTAFVLQLKQSDAVLKDYLRQLGDVLYQLCEKYKTTITAAVAHKTFAAPTTLGFKLGIVLNELDHLMTKLDSLGPFTFAGSLAGADGTSSMLGSDYRKIEHDFCEHLGLATPEMYWHTQRERFTEYSHVETMIAQVIGRLGKNLLYMSETIVGEFQEGYAPGR
ncbi:MAG: 3-carboxy-cis,cis-muconate cycloisomerase, partial [Lentilactobacillus parabuchneri]|nr:3-carboxy-cis,cis-muconate cycloisomerase [Lentilactobacillus parabuchneri]